MTATMTTMAMMSMELELAAVPSPVAGVAAAVGAAPPDASADGAALASGAAFVSRVYWSVEYVKNGVPFADGCFVQPANRSVR